MAGLRGGWGGGKTLRSAGCPGTLREERLVRRPGVLWERRDSVGPWTPWLLKTVSRQNLERKRVQELPQVLSVTLSCVATSWQWLDFLLQHQEARCVLVLWPPLPSSITQRTAVLKEETRSVSMAIVFLGLALLIARWVRRVRGLLSVPWWVEAVFGVTPVCSRAKLRVGMALPGGEESLGLEWPTQSLGRFQVFLF